MTSVIRIVGLVLFVCMSISIGVNLEPAVNYADATEGVKEYCLNEEFQAACLKNEVVIMKSAVFGRMTMGRCLQDEGEFMLKKYGNDPTYFGCSIDVLNLVNAKCSGVNHCTMQIMYDIDQKLQRPCLPALRNYLEASYECVAIIEPDRTCTVSVTSHSQHITSVNSSTELSCGSRHQPWKLEAPAGQQINVSLLHFGRSINQRDGDCLQYGYIIDREAHRNVSLCGLNSERKSIVYQSKGHALSLILAINAESSQISKILIGVQAVGCTDLVPSEDMWLRRRNQEAVVGCYSSRQTWYLNCVNNQWLGVIGNCTREISQPVLSEMKTGTTSIKSTVLASVVIVSIGLAICVAIIICGLICIKRYNSIIANKSHIYNMDGGNKGKDYLVNRERFLPEPLHRA